MIWSHHTVRRAPPRRRNSIFMFDWIGLYTHFRWNIAKTNIYFASQSEPKRLSLSSHTVEIFVPAGNLQNISTWAHMYAHMRQLLGTTETQKKGSNGVAMANKSVSGGRIYHRICTLRPRWARSHKCRWISQTKQQPTTASNYFEWTNFGPRRFSTSLFSRTKQTMFLPLEIGKSNDGRNKQQLGNRYQIFR